MKNIKYYKNKLETCKIWSSRVALFTSCHDTSCLWARLDVTSSKAAYAMMAEATDLEMYCSYSDEEEVDNIEVIQAYQFEPSGCSASSESDGDNEVRNHENQLQDTSWFVK